MDAWFKVPNGMSHRKVRKIFNECCSDQGSHTSRDRVGGGGGEKRRTKKQHLAADFSKETNELVGGQLAHHHC